MSETILFTARLENEKINFNIKSFFTDNKQKVYRMGFLETWKQFQKSFVMNERKS